VPRSFPNVAKLCSSLVKRESPKSHTLILMSLSIYSTHKPNKSIVRLCILHSEYFITSKLGLFRSRWTICGFQRCKLFVPFVVSMIHLRTKLQVNLFFMSCKYWNRLPTRRHLKCNWFKIQKSKRKTEQNDYLWGNIQEPYTVWVRELRRESVRHKGSVRNWALPTLF
jgi:hypothetical protein